MGASRNREQAFTLRRVACALLWLAGCLAGMAAAEWKLVDERACEGPIITLTSGQLPEEQRCSPEMAGKAALCYSEVCQPHCLYFDYPLERCKAGADLGKRYTCAPK
jgi:hypothetical protein